MVQKVKKESLDGDELFIQNNRITKVQFNGVRIKLWTFSLSLVKYHGSLTSCQL